MEFGLYKNLLRIRITYILLLIKHVTSLQTQLINSCYFSLNADPKHTVPYIFAKLQKHDKILYYKKQLPDESSL